MKTVAYSRAACPLDKSIARSSGRSFHGTPVKMAVPSRCVPSTRRMSLKPQSVAQAVKPSSPSKKSDVISAEVAKDLYRDMILGREFEEMCAQMYYRGKMFGFVHLYSGQEAVSTGRLRSFCCRFCQQQQERERK